MTASRHYRSALSHIETAMDELEYLFEQYGDDMAEELLHDLAEIRDRMKGPGAN